MNDELRVAPGAGVAIVTAVAALVLAFTAGLMAAIWTDQLKSDFRNLNDRLEQCEERVVSEDAVRRLLEGP